MLDAATDIFLRGVAVGAGAGMVFLSWLQIMLRRWCGK